jgi:hypothetical protein
MSHQTALALLRESPLAPRESTLESWCEALATGIDVADMPKVQAAAARRTPSGSVGTFGFMGPIFHRPNLLSLLFGGTSIVEARRALADLVDDSRVETVVIEFDTPGGAIDGPVEYTAELRAARQKKPILAYREHDGVFGRVLARGAVLGDHRHAEWRCRECGRLHVSH